MIGLYSEMLSEIDNLSILIYESFIWVIHMSHWYESLIQLLAYPFPFISTDRVTYVFSEYVREYVFSENVPMVTPLGAYRTVADCHTEATCHTEWTGTQDIYSADVHVCYLSTLSAELSVIFAYK